MEHMIPYLLKAVHPSVTKINLPDTEEYSTSWLKLQTLTSSNLRALLQLQADMQFLQIQEHELRSPWTWRAQQLKNWPYPSTSAPSQKQ